MLVVLSDEEAGGDFGAKFLVEQHPELFEGMRYALGEFGGFTLYAGGKRFYPIQVAEKQICWLKATVRGPGGHGALVHRGGTVARLGRLLTDLDRKRMPVHVTPIVREMVETIAATLPRPQAAVMRSVLKPRFTDSALRLMGEKGALFEPMLRNTVNATIVRGGAKINVVPSEIELELDGRALPGFSPDASDRRAAGPRRRGRRARADPPRSRAVRARPRPLRDARGRHPRARPRRAIPLPLLQIGVTDGRFFSRAGVQTYGFLPMRLPEDFQFTKLIHAADERIPVDALEFGAEAVWRAIQRFH